MSARSEWREGAPGVLTSGAVWSQSRPATVNVLMWSADNADGNNVYARPRGLIADVVRDLVEQTWRELRPTLAQRYPDAIVTVRPDYCHRGRWTYTVWSHPLVESVDVDRECPVTSRVSARDVDETRG
ncbi:hypothetical protein KNU10_gp89 [Gordonia phage Foxboro]|uniref:Uncharacterized protein n=1 Tax=Gordonia phage Foxboro TaxID=2301602 RepID=A0A385UED6_9CAUD|nr:hypothetical protein KNU10_gp89 [Gordonia phage Foxboro]AYB69230.1 hypothetical protein SEA_FOXBORO_89 [Gordonia phage Foxboro]